VQTSKNGKTYSVFYLRSGISKQPVFWGLLAPFIAGAWGVFVPPKTPQTPKGGSRRGKEGRIAFLLPHFPLLENPPPLKSKKLKLFLLGKKTVGFLSQPLLPKGEDSLRK
jgi:hypothetical protein